MTRAHPLRERGSKKAALVGAAVDELIALARVEGLDAIARLVTAADGWDDLAGSCHRGYTPTLVTSLGRARPTEDNCRHAAAGQILAAKLTHLGHRIHERPLCV